MKRLYTALFTLGIPLLILRLLWRGFRSPAYWHRWPERFGTSPVLSPDRSVIWIHAVSVGEVEACRPLVKAFQSEYADHQILITTMTPTGSARVTLLFADSVAHCYLPYDLPFAIQRFIDKTHPQFAVIMETEIWPNLISCCQQKEIPVVLANARLSARSAKAYARVAALTKSVLQQLTFIAAQNADDKERFQQLGANHKNVHIMGNLKYEMDLPVDLREQGSTLRSMWGANRPVLIAASTHEGEEEMMLNAAKQIRSLFPDLLLIIVPRHPERFDRVAALVQRSGVKTFRRSEHQPCCSDVQALVIDTMGELPLFYAASDIAFVGGSLVPHGGHNLLEAAILGRAVITGPHFFNFHEITSQFLQAQAAVKVLNTEELAQICIHLFQNSQQRAAMGETGLQLIANSQGACTRLVNLIKHYVIRYAK